MLQGAFRLLHGGGSEDALQLLVHLTHPIGGGCGQCVQERHHILAGAGLSGELSLHVHHRRGPAILQH
jgi:hypothetical protein